MTGKQADSRIARALFGLFFGLIAFAVAGSIISHLTGIDSGMVARVTAATVLATGAALVAMDLGKGLRVVFLAVLASVAEVCGVFTGFPFGHYSYSDAWWPSIEVRSHTLPLLLPFAWLLIAGGASAFVGSRLKGGWRWVVAAGLAAMIDAPMEVYMTRVSHYWNWEGDRVPWTNLVGWFGVSLFATLPFWGAPVKGGRSGMVLGAFCVFLAVTGSLNFLAPAWPILALIGITMFLLSLKNMKAAAVS